jgi:hypothetical protein
MVASDSAWLSKRQGPQFLLMPFLLLVNEQLAIEMFREPARALLQTLFDLLDDLRIGLNCLLGL